MNGLRTKRDKGGKGHEKGYKDLVGLWAAFFLTGFILISYYRQQEFEGRIEENISNLEETVKESSVILERDWETLDKNDPEELSGYFEEKALSLYFIYFLDYNEYLQNEEELFSGTFRTQARESALLEIQSKILSAYLTINEKWACHFDTAEISGHAEEYCRILLKYYQGEDHNVLWDDFVRSDQYEAFLNELFSSVETIEELPFDESYQSIIDRAERAASRSIYSRVLSESYMFLAETAYDEYQKHKSQKDFAGAIMDAEIVYILNDTLDNLDEVSAIREIPLTKLDSGFFYVHDIISDILAVHVLSTLIAVAVCVVRKEMLTRQDRP
ncbi:MAG: hypothetical protein WBA22_16445 [Candidatus Methanofastidiosia archaeon]